ncbi:hypothetical protein KIPB_005943 [Kipferlia bialata]|uniref:Uncharacterized protein n=1 Tax=Kipferlia bialata TaxID=797122 RepID=A0A9K3CWG7_9EUKA|nr:hypothetical protein KIPB_005943 [Kipferlia bialata]|eukprot:g5943.t1
MPSADSMGVAMALADRRQELLGLIAQWQSRLHTLETLSGFIPPATPAHLPTPPTIPRYPVTVQTLSRAVDPYETSLLLNPNMVMQNSDDEGEGGAPKDTEPSGDKGGEREGGKAADKGADRGTLERTDSTNTTKAEARADTKARSALERAAGQTGWVHGSMRRGRVLSLGTKVKKRESQLLTQTLSEACQAAARRGELVPIGLARYRQEAQMQRWLRSYTLRSHRTQEERMRRYKYAGPPPPPCPVSEGAAPPCVLVACGCMTSEGSISQSAEWHRGSEMHAQRRDHMLQALRERERLRQEAMASQEAQMGPQSTPGHASTPASTSAPAPAAEDRGMWGLAEAVSGSRQGSILPQPLLAGPDAARYTAGLRAVQRSDGSAVPGRGRLLPLPPSGLAKHLAYGGVTLHAKAADHCVNKLVLKDCLTEVEAVPVQGQGSLTEMGAYAGLLRHMGSTSGRKDVNQRMERHLTARFKKWRGRIET